MDDIIENYGYIQYSKEKDLVIPFYETANFFKRIDDSVNQVCRLNGHLSLKISTANFRGNFSWEISLTAETPDEHWVDMKFYSLQYTDLAKLEKFEKALMVMWEAALVV